MNPPQPDVSVRGRRRRLHYLPVLAVGCVYAVVTSSAYVLAPSLGGESWPLKADQVGYYAYLPALLTDGGLSFTDMVGPRWDRFEAEGFAGFAPPSIGGRRINTYGPGVAILQAPLFVAADVIAHLVGAETDGFSGPYRLLAALGGAAYATLGLLFVFLALRSRFSVAVAATVVCVLGLGTNLFYYATFEPLMTHAYSFFAFSVLLWAMLSWSRAPSLALAIVAGAALGVVVMLRPTNGVVALAPVGYVTARKVVDGEPADRFLLLRHLLVAAGITFVTSLPLFAYWRFATGHWITNPRGSGTFFLAEPRIWSVLWSYRKGWFVYTPIMLAAIPGFYLLPRYVPRVALPIGLCAAALIYIDSAWWNWWFGGSFGMRALIELSSMFSLPLAALVAWGRDSARKRRAMTSIFTVLIALNVFQTYQYVRGYIHWDGMTKNTYWAVFLRPWIPPEEFREIQAGWNLELPRLPRQD